MKKFTILALAALLVVPLASAGLVDLIATGVVASTGASDTAGIDDFWTANGGSAYVQTSPGAIAPGWVDPAAGAEWVSNQAVNSPNASTAIDYDLVFDLTGLGGATELKFRVSGDDDWLVMLNGVATGDTSAAPPPDAWSLLSPTITLNSGFNPGSNTLRIRTTNTAGGPAGGLVVFESATSIPEPGTYLLVGLGLAGVAFFRRRRRA